MMLLCFGQVEAGALKERQEEAEKEAHEWKQKAAHLQVRTTCSLFGGSECVLLCLQARFCDDFLPLHWCRSAATRLLSLLPR